jgi:hypothetical protein
MLCNNRLVGHAILGPKKVEKRFCFIFQKKWKKKHVDVNHGLIVKKIEEEVNNSLKSPLEK